MRTKFPSAAAQNIYVTISSGVETPVDQKCGEGRPSRGRLGKFAGCNIFGKKWPVAGLSPTFPPVKSMISAGKPPRCQIVAFGRAELKSRDVQLAIMQMPVVRPEHSRHDIADVNSP